uniref:Derlin n=1 Tax=Ciona savignyi TaxID=51511 RepID=H2Z1B2_CIOSA
MSQNDLGDWYRGIPKITRYWFTACVVVPLALNIPIVFELLVLAALYIWCQINRDQIVSFWFGTRFKAAYLPWVLFAFNLIIRGGGIHELLGIFVGHTYFFLKFKYPLDFGGTSLIETPQFLYKYFPNTRSGVSGFGAAPASRRREEDNGGDVGGGARHRWGEGRRLGD